MKKFLIVWILLSIYVNLNAQQSNENSEPITKFASFTSRAGSIMSFEDYNKTSLTSLIGTLNMNKRIVKVGSEQKTFYLFQIPNKYGTRSAMIAKEDADELMKAINTLLEDSKVDISTQSEYMEKYFITEDHFKVGYYLSNKVIKWYIDVDTRRSESTYFLKDIESLIEKLKFIMQ